MIGHPPARPISPLLAALAPIACLVLLAPAHARADASATAAAGPAQKATLAFLRNGAPVRTLDLDALRHACGARRIEIDDPYYGRKMAFLACPLRTVLTLGFGTLPDGDPSANYFLRARDGYVKPVSGERLLEDGAWLAFADADLTPSTDAGATGPLAPRWAPIDRRQLDPAPFYLVWTGAAQQDSHRYPWPYQLVSIEAAPFESEFPHTAPTGAPPGAPAWRGYALFRTECIACHSVNGEGGKIGPDLNVPRSIVEYRPVDQIKAYVRDPQSFRYTSMPAHPHLTDADLGALIAYFEAMSARKHDPGRAH